MLLKSRFYQFSIALLLLASGPLLADRISAGEAHNLVARGDGGQFVWGANAAGQLGDGTTLDALNPIEVRDIRYNALAGAIAVVSYGNNNLVLLDDATLLGWGPNENGQLGSGLLYGGKFKGETPTDPGDGTDPEQPVEPAATPLVFPTEVVDPEGKPIANIVSIALGANFAAAVNQAGNVLVWGNNLDVFTDREVDREPPNRYRDKFFDPTIAFVDSRYKDGDPVADSSLLVMRDALGNRYTGIIKVAVGDNHLLALTNAGLVLAWGENSAGQLADGTQVQRPYPVYVQSDEGVFISTITSLAARGNTSVAVKSNGILLGWGDSAISGPVEVAGIDISTDISIDETSASSAEKSYAQPLFDGEGNQISNVYKIALGDSHALAITQNRRVISFGSNSNGQLGDGTNLAVTGTASVRLSNGQPLGNIIEVSAGATHSLALRADGYVFSWGLGENGRLGDGTNIDSYYAVNVRNQYNGPFSLFGY